MKYLIFILSLMLLASPIYGCDDIGEPSAVAVINELEISHREYESRVKQLSTLFEELGGRVTEEVEEDIRRHALDDLIGEFLLYDAARKESIELSQSEVEKAFDNFAAQFEDEEQLRTHLRNLRMSEDDMKNQITRQMKVEEFLDNYMTEKLVERDVQFTEQEIKHLHQMYSQQLADFPTLEEVEPQLRVEALHMTYIEILNDLIDQLESEGSVKIMIDIDTD